MDRPLTPVFPAILLLLFLSVGRAWADALTPLFKSANTLDSLGDHVRARDQLRRLLRSAPRHPGALALRAFIDVREGNQPRAATTYRELAAIHPQAPYTRALKQFLDSFDQRAPQVRTARLMEKAGRHATALKKWHEAYPEGLAPGPLAYEYALVIKSLGKIERARQILQSLLEHYPGNLQYRLAVNKLDALQPEQRDAVIAVFSEMTSYSAFEREAHAAWRELLIGFETPGEAIPLIEQYLVRYPDDYRVKDHLVALRKHRQEHKPTTQTSKTAEGKTRKITHPPELARARRLIEQKRYDKAEILLSRVVRRFPEQGEALGYLGLIQLRQGHYHKARKLFQRAARHDLEQRRGKWRSLTRTAHYWGLLANAEKAKEDGQAVIAEQQLLKAIALDPGEATGYAYLGDILLAHNQLAEAEQRYRKALRLEPENWTALRSMSQVQARRSPLLAVRYLEGMNPRQQRKLGSEYSRMLASALRDLADSRLASGDIKGARRALQRAVKIAPALPWSRYDLARLLVASGQADAGVRIFEKGLALSPTDPEMRYAFALYLQSLEREMEAIAQLDAIPEQEMTPKYRTMHTRLWAESERRKALALYKKGKKTQAMQRLQAAETPAALSTPAAAERLASAWLAIKHPRRAVDLLSRALRHQPETNIDAHLQLIIALHEASMLRAAAAQIHQLWHCEQLTRAQTERLTQLDIDNTLLRVKQAQAAGDYTRAHRQLDLALARLPAQPELLYAQSRVLLALGEKEAALTDLRTAIGLAPEEPSYRMMLIEYLLEHNQHNVEEEIQNLLEVLPPEDTNNRLRLIALLNRAGWSESTTWLITRLARDYKGNRELLLSPLARQQDREAPAQALALYRQTLLDDDESSWTKWADEAPIELAGEVDTLLQRQRRILTLALDYGSRSATAGLSTLFATRLPIEGRQPLLGGQLFVHVEPTHLDAGRLDTVTPDNRAELGTNLFCTTGCSRLRSKQSARGTGLLLGYENTHWHIDAGTTPIGFPVSYFIGALQYKNSLGPVDWRIELSQRPVTSSLLSYAGAIDPNTGRSWGGVRTTGITLGLSHDTGGAWGAWSNLQFHQLRGKEIPTNNRVRLLAGTYYKWVREPNERLSLSLNGMTWRHERNLGEYTWGHGGYYSPQFYISLSTALDWYGRTERWSWEARGAISRSRSRTDSAPYFPGDPLLQANAEAIAPTTGINPNYDASSGPGTGISFEGAIEYRVSRFLHIGARVSLAWSQDYATNRGMLYLRLTDKPGLGPLPMPPEAPLCLPDY